MTTTVTEPMTRVAGTHLSGERLNHFELRAARAVFAHLGFTGWAQTPPNPREWSEDETVAAIVAFADAYALMKMTLDSVVATHGDERPAATVELRPPAALHALALILDPFVKKLTMSPGSLAELSARHAALVDYSTGGDHA